KNEADRRVLELLTEKFQLFDGLFGASDDILGSIESGLDFEKRIAAIYENDLRDPAAIQAAFDALQKELEDDIAKRMSETRDKLFEYFDANIHDKLRLKQQEAQLQLDKMSRMFWQLTTYMLQNNAIFNSNRLSFQLQAVPAGVQAAAGLYQLVSKNKELPHDEQAHKYRLGHPLGEWVLDNGRRLDTGLQQVSFNLSDYGRKVSSLDTFTGQSGWLELNLLQITSFQFEEHLVFTAFTDAGQRLDDEQCADLFLLNATISGTPQEPVPDMPTQNASLQLKSRLNEMLEENNEYFTREREKLDLWAEDQMKAVEQKLEDTRAELKA